MTNSILTGIAYLLCGVMFGLGVLAIREYRRKAKIDSRLRFVVFGK